MGLLGIIFGILGIFSSGLVFIPLGLLCTIFSLLSGRIMAGIVSLCVNIMAIIVSPSAWIAILALLSVASNSSQQTLSKNNNNTLHTNTEIFEQVQSASSIMKKAVVIAENANLRKASNKNSDVVQVLPRGTNVLIIKQQGAWFLVEYGSQNGWMHGNTIQFVEK